MAPAPRITLRRPDDWHLHLRDGAALASVVGATARTFGRAIVMPNLRPPVTTVDAALAYRDRIRSAAGPSSRFVPLMTLYLTDNTSADEIAKAKASGAIVAVKVYPAGATTNSDAGVTSLDRARHAIAAIEKHGLVLSLHGEVTDADVDVFDRERVYVERTLGKLTRDFPGLRIVLEHVTTREAAEFVAAAGANVAATITPQHLHINRNAMFAGGIRPHAYCLPVAKRELHRLALRRAATSGSPKFFLGTDSAPHAVAAKEAACGCAGIFNAPYALESYVTVFDEEDALEHFEAFASRNGPAFYGLPVNADTVTLKRGSTEVPAVIDANGTAIVPFHAGEVLGWRLRD